MIFSQSEFDFRLKKIKSSMNNKGLDLIIITDPSNMNYTTGYDGWSFYVPQGVIISLDHNEPIWFGRMQDSKGAKITTFLKEENILGYPEDLIQSPPQHPYDYLTNFLKTKKWDKKNIGVEMDSYYYSAECHARLLNQFPEATFHDANLLVNWIRLIKSENEIKYMKDASVLVQLGMQKAYNTIKLGVRQSEVAGNIQNTLLSGTDKMGGEYSGLTIILASGISASASHLTPTDKKFVNNEGTIIELGGVKNRYHCPMSRTVFIGKPDIKTIETMKITNEAFENALKFIKPGNTANDVAVGFWEVLSKHGLEKDSRLGYSIGLGYPPDWGEHTMSIRKNDMTVLQPNLTFHMIAGMWMDTWGLEVSESIQVTDNGYKLFCNFSRSLHLI
jgi:Xaa-Pro dipeptidase/ectoine hydrolase